MANTANSTLFISHSSKDDAIVRALQQQLASHGVEAWIDSRHLRGGDVLEQEITSAIEKADAYGVLVSPVALQSAWVGKELKHALAVQQQRQAAGQPYRVVPLSLDGTRLGVLEAFFTGEVLYLPLSSEAGGVEVALDAILVALGQRLPADVAPAAPLGEQALEELVLELSDLAMHEQDGKRRATARARLVYYPATPGCPPVASTLKWPMQAPLGPIEADDLRWYLEKYAIWPGSVFANRKQGIEQKLPHWGGLLYEQAMQQPVMQQALMQQQMMQQAAAAPLASHATREVLAAWHAVPQAAVVNRRFSVLVDATPDFGASAEQVQQAREAAGAWLALPWELLHDGTRFLFQGAHATRVRRRLPGDKAHDALRFDLPIRILVISPRPEDDACSYIDHRLSARPLVAAAQALPGQVDLHILQTPTYDGLQDELMRARQARTPYHVIHFDGHGVYDPHQGLGALCFEHPDDAAQWENRRHVLVHTDKLGPLLRDHRIPLVFLEACQSAKAEQATESVATALLKVGVASVVAMSHSVLVETARRFVGRFYQCLAEGARVGEAMLAGQQYLAADSVRGQVFGEGDFHLHDWFVPVLYQEQTDPVLFRSRVAAQTVADYQTGIEHRLGDTPAAPESGFIGRSRELLALQRRLMASSPGAAARLRYCVILGQGGEGKTTLAAECARWLVCSQQIERAAFVSVENRHGLTAVVDAFGRQLVGQRYSSAQYATLDEQTLPIERALREQATLLVLDNMESILPPPWLPTTPVLQEQAAQDLAAILAWVQRVMAIGETRVMFTSREALPKPFADQAAHLALAHLALNDAVQLIESALGSSGAGAGAAARARLDQIEELARGVHCHARTLALLAPNLQANGVVQTQADLAELMAQMERDFPGEREKSLFAGVALSLKRLSPQNRVRVRVLGLFHGTVDLDVLRVMMDWPEEEVNDLAQALVQTGLATPGPYGHLTLNPALCPCLHKQLAAAQAADHAARWQAAMLAYIGFLVQQQSQNIEMAAVLTALELGNLFALLAQVESAGDAAATIALATSLYGLLQNLGKPKLAARVGQVRDAAHAHLGSTWQHAHFEAARTRIEQQLAGGQMQAALAGAQALLQQALAAGAQAYPAADYDGAVAHFLLGRVLRMGGKAEAALPYLQQAEQAFASVANCRGQGTHGKAAAERMASACMTEQADCLRALGQFDAAAVAYQTAITHDEQRGAARDVAVGKFQLGTVYLQQKRYPEALAAYEAARTRFAALNEPGTVASAWHQIGMTHEEAGEPGKAEDAYRQALAIMVRLGDVAGQGETLGQLGNLYQGPLQQPEQAAVFYRQALDHAIAAGNKATEGRWHSNLANTLCTLGQWLAARQHIRQAIACKTPFGHAAEPWKTWSILADIESATSDTAAAQAAKQQATALYLAYRRAGGENHSGRGRLCADIHAMLQAGQVAQAQALLHQRKQEYAANTAWQALLAALQALSNGSRAEKLAQDEHLHYADAAEITLLLSSLPPAS